MKAVERILQKMREDEVFEVMPVTGIFKDSDIPRGYSGECYYRDDPRLVKALVELEKDGWDLSQF